MFFFMVILMAAFIFVPVLLFVNFMTGEFKELDEWEKDVDRRRTRRMDERAKQEGEVMANKTQNQAEQQLESMSAEDKMTILKLLNAKKWFYLNGKCHALRNPWVSYETESQI